MAHFTDLPPEVLALIGDLIDTGATKKSLVLVSQFCRQHFTHLRWRQLRIGSRSWRFAKVLKPHAQLVRMLQFESGVYKGFYEIDFPGLVSFETNYPEKDKKNKDVVVTLADFISRHRTIRDITINTREMRLSHRIWETVLASLLNPRRLRLEGGLPWGSVKNFICGPAFWQACSRFEEVFYKGWDQSGSLELGTVDFSQLKCLDYTATPLPIDAAKIWRWMGTCSNLTRLHWGGTIPIEQLATVTERPVWPHLEDFSLEYVRGSDEDLAAYILSHLPPLKHLKLSIGYLGPACFGILQERHLDSLRTLSMPGTKMATRKMALDILLQSPKLVAFKVLSIDLRDLRSNPQPWACRAPKHLQATFESDPNDPEADILLLKQLSKLVHLEGLNVRSYSTPIDFIDSVITEPSPSCIRAGRDLEIEDIEWMMDQWPLLKTLSGRFTLDSTTQDTLMALI
ncbi:hypothetical protein BG015_005349, partial [Linnemannia schmuckeri]